MSTTLGPVNLNRIVVFVAVVEAGSLTVAPESTVEPDVKDARRFGVD